MAAEAQHDNHYLLEVRCEELPAGLLPSLLQQWDQALRERLAERHLMQVQVRVTGTPRRLVAHLSQLPDLLPDTFLEVKGPPVRIAFDAEGQPTKATLGFLAKNNATLQQVTQEVMGNETYLVLRQVIPGEPMRNSVAALVVEAFQSLRGPRFMRWGHTQWAFSRPVQGLLSLWNDTVLPVSLSLATEGCTVCADAPETLGHRTLAKQTPVIVPSVQQYWETLAEHGCVLVDAQQRQQRIAQQLEAAAASLSGCLVPDSELLTHVTHLVEWPRVVVGNFDPAYLQLPKPVLITVMKAHQKYFSVEAANGQLMPVFLCVSNAGASAENAVQRGNQRVLKARLDDALFFLNEDLKRPLVERLPDLDGVTFQKGLGSLGDKTRRLMALAPMVAKALRLDEIQAQQLQQAAQLCKTDLVTQMVFELTELQGAMGAEYARRQGVSEAVAVALEEQYWPRFSGDSLPQTAVGTALSLLDKLDTVVAVFAQADAKLPSGSRDPMALRRMTLGLLQMVDGLAFPLDLLDLAHAVYQAVPHTADWLTTEQRLREFFAQRLVAWLREAGTRHDLLNSILDSGDFLRHWHTLKIKQARLTTLATEQPEFFSALCEAANRIERILGNQAPAFSAELMPLSQSVQESLLSSGAEQALWQQVQPLVVAHHNHSLRPDSLLTLPPAIAAFFDAVMVNDPDNEKRRNRYAVLGCLHVLLLNYWGRLSQLQHSDTSLTATTVPTAALLSM